MQLEQNFKLDQPSLQVWAAFKNVESLVACLPGAMLTGPAVDGELPLRFEVKLGPIAAAFVGSGRVTFDDAAQRGKFEGQATDKRTGSRVKGTAVFSLTPESQGTLVGVNVDYALTGALAQFSRGAIVRDLASVLTDRFASNLEAKMGESMPIFHASGSTKNTRASDSTSPVNAQLADGALDGWTLIKQVFAARFRHWLGLLGWGKAK